MKTYQQLASATVSSCRTIGRVSEHRLSKDIHPASERAAVGDAGSLIAITGLLVGLLLTPLQANADDAVMEWNQIALAATVTAGQGPVPQLRTMAIVQVSVHDAVNAITCDYRTYLSIRCGPWGTPEAAAIGAAHRALLGLLPAQEPALIAARDASLAAHGLTDSDPGVAFGEAVADVLLAVAFDRRFGAGPVSVYRSRRWKSGRVGGSGPRPPGAARLEECLHVGPAQPFTIPTQWSAAPAQPALCARLQRGEGAWVADQPDADG